MGNPDIRPLRSSNCHRLKSSLSLCSFSNVSLDHAGTSENSANFRQRSHKPFRQRRDFSDAFHKGRLLDSIVFNPKKGRDYAPRYRSERSEFFFVGNAHFQIEHLSTIKYFLKQGHYMTKLDLKDAYLSVAIHPQSQKYPRFIWKNKT